MKKLDRGIIQSIMKRPTRVVLLGYLSYILLTWILLCLPISWQDGFISPLDNLFIAASAISTTGLITVNTPDAYSFFGELVIACAFQVGGLGYMTLGSFVVLARERRLSAMRRQVGETVFSLPESLNLRTFIRHTIIFTVLIEIAGFIGLYIAFSQQEVPNSLWAAIFHSISAFCTAGFSIFPDSLMGFRGNLLVNFVVTVLSIFGAIGFIVVSDIWLSFKNSERQITLTTKIILYSTFSVLIFGWGYLFFADASMTALPLGERLLSSWFQSMTAMTTVGFNTHPIENLVASSVLLMLILMIIGASPSGTGGGLKTTSVSAAIGAVWATLRGQPNVTISQRRIPVSSLTSAFAAVMFYLLMFLGGSLCLLMLQGQAFEDVLFEAASALGTVGLSRGITGDLTPLGKLVVIVLMFIGRVGPMTFGLALFKQPVQDRQLDEEDIAL